MTQLSSTIFEYLEQQNAVRSEMDSLKTEVLAEADRLKEAGQDDESKHYIDIITVKPKRKKASKVVLP